MNDLLLNKYQKNSLRIALLLVEQAMIQIQLLLDKEDNVEGVLYGIKDDLSAEEKACLKNYIPQIRKILAQLKEEFTLEKQMDDKSRLIFGRLPYLWEILMDSTAKKMKSYGEVAPGLAEKLNPPINILADLILKMTDIVEPAKREERLKK
jgi:hypothetical protein